MKQLSVMTALVGLLFVCGASQAVLYDFVDADGLILGTIEIDDNYASPVSAWGRYNSPRIILSFTWFDDASGIDDALGGGPSGSGISIPGAMGSNTGRTIDYGRWQINTVQYQMNSRLGLAYDMFHSHVCRRIDDSSGSGQCWYGIWRARAPEALAPLILAVLGDINGDGNLDIAALERKDGSTTATVKDAVNRTRIRTIRINGEFPPVDFEVMPDVNGNGAPELVVLRTAIDRRISNTQFEIRDSLTGEHLEPFFRPHIRRRTPIDLEMVADQTGDAVPELAVLEPIPLATVLVRDGLTHHRVVSHIRFRDSYVGKDFSVWSRGKSALVAILADHVSEIRSDKVEIRDLDTGRVVKHLWIGKAWDLLQMELVADLNGNGSPELAILREHPDDNWVSVQAIDTASGSRFKRLGFDPQYRPVRFRVLDDLNGNGSQEVAVLAVRRGCCNQKVWVKDTLTGESIRIAYFGKQFIGDDLAISPDINGNGTPELVVLGRRNDGKVAAIIKDSKTAEFISWVGF